MPLSDKDLDALPGLRETCTPGPWEWDDAGDLIAPDSGQWNALVLSGSTYNDADARLLALAPELAAEVLRLRAALVEAEEVLRLVEHPASPQPHCQREVEALGAAVGFGAMMTAAQAAWRKDLETAGYPVGGEFVAGPCYGTVLTTLAKVRAALAPNAPGQGEEAT